MVSVCRLSLALSISDVGCTNVGCDLPHALLRQLEVSLIAGVLAELVPLEDELWSRRLALWDAFVRLETYCASFGNV